MFVGRCRHFLRVVPTLKQKHGLGHTKQVDSGTDLCDLCRGRRPWCQDGRAVICSPWWLEDEEDEARVKGREKGKQGKEGKGGMSRQRSRERRGIEAGGKYEWMPR
ncbi:hypothetical protein VZT92_026274 [Zoarces viviparus]|uniref:Uncharacterized protein n=1 Tax=Zoarces viviparus TaxID=48416 RepID=A0AAW1DZ04_ZOAVI